MTHALFRILTLIILIVCTISVYLINVNTPIVVATDTEATIQFHATPVLLPDQSTTISWKANKIASIYFNDEGVVGEGSQEFVVSLCESNQYPLDIVLQNDEILLLSIEPNILIFDPLFMGLIIAIVFQVLAFIPSVQRLINQTTLAKQVQSTLIIFAITLFLTYLLLPVVEIAFRTVFCS